MEPIVGRTISWAGNPKGTGRKCRHSVGVSATNEIDREGEGGSTGGAEQRGIKPVIAKKGCSGTKMKSRNNLDIHV